MKLKSTMIAILIHAGLVGAVPLAAHAEGPVTHGVVATAPGQAVILETTKISAIVVGIDEATREVTLKGEKGKVFTVTAGDQVRNFDQIKIGDRVTAKYVEALTLDLKKGGKGAPERSEKHEMVRAAPGAKPAGAIGREVTVLADVIAVDHKKKLVTLRGPLGNLVDLHVQDPAQLKNIKKGDQVEAVYTEALAISVEEMPKTEAK